MKRTVIAERDAGGLSDFRGQVEVLASRVGLLRGEDRLLMEMYLNHGNSFRQMARLLGVNSVTVSRRVRKLCERLVDGEYIECLKNREKFTATEMEIAKDYFLSGLSMRKIAVKRGYSRHAVKGTVRKLKAVVGGTVKGAEEKLLRGSSENQKANIKMKNDI